MLFKNGNAKPILIGSIENEAERQMLSERLASQNMTLDDVELVSIDEAEQRGLFENAQFLAMIQKMGFNNADEMRATVARMRRNGMMGDASSGGSSAPQLLPKRPENDGGGIKFGDF